MRSDQLRESGSWEIECDQYEEKEAGNTTSPFEAQGWPDLAPRLEFAAPAGRELDELQGAVVEKDGECFGGEGAGGAEMTKRGPPSKAVHTPTRANFVLCPHEIGYFVFESGRHRRYSDGKRRNQSFPYQMVGMMWLPAA
jgi:hypothetical protein